MQKRINETADSTMPNLPSKGISTSHRNMLSPLMHKDIAESQTARNIGELSPDLLLPDDINGIRQYFNFQLSARFCMIAYQQL